MKNFILLLSLILFPAISFSQNALLNKPMPLLPAKTLDGKTIDESYYKGHITLVTFMYIGCPPCMNEISVLNKLNNEYAGNPQVQVLCVARQMREQMVQFNTDSLSLFGRIRAALGAEKIKYSIQPACGSAESKMIISGSDSAKNISIKSECGEISDVYGVSSFPTAFFVGRNGIIRQIHSGGPATRNDQQFYNYIKAEIDKLIAE